MSLEQTDRLNELFDHGIAGSIIPHLAIQTVRAELLFSLSGLNADSIGAATGTIQLRINEGFHTELGSEKKNDSSTDCST